MLHVAFYRVRGDRVDRLQRWVSELQRRADEVRETFAEEGVTHEAAYLLDGSQGPILVYAVEANDEDRARAVFATSRRPIDVQHRAVMADVLTGTLEVQPLYELRAVSQP